MAEVKADDGAFDALAASPKLSGVPKPSVGMEESESDDEDGAPTVQPPWISRLGARGWGLAEFQCMRQGCGKRHGAQELPSGCIVATEPCRGGDPLHRYVAPRCLLLRP